MFCLVQQFSATMHTANYMPNTIRHLLVWRMQDAIWRQYNNDKNVTSKLHPVINIFYLSLYFNTEMILRVDDVTFLSYCIKNLDMF